MDTGKYLYRFFAQCTSSLLLLKQIPFCSECFNNITANTNTMDSSISNENQMTPSPNICGKIRMTSESTTILRKALILVVCKEHSVE
jgi:hypothetical protein